MPQKQAHSTPMSSSVSKMRDITYPMPCPIFLPVANSVSSLPNAGLPWSLYFIRRSRRLICSPLSGGGLLFRPVRRRLPARPAGGHTLQ